MDADESDELTIGAPLLRRTRVPKLSVELLVDDGSLAGTFKIASSSKYRAAKGEEAAVLCTVKLECEGYKRGGDEPVFRAAVEVQGAYDLVARIERFDNVEIKFKSLLSEPLYLLGAKTLEQAINNLDLGIVRLPLSLAEIRSKAPSTVKQKSRTAARKVGAQSRASAKRKPTEDISE